ncbi:NAD(P)/FAD-dependent oxidoreductase [Acidithiobacillus ferrivorans]|uniref:FAD-binding oxidoreductase n=1 Tax=Acidithiobacillus ferrivorans TaxID=160808 RepID=A0A7T4WFM8_9PROT|nr:FAD-binding oxidoreductase [Acidithiobacillus ferrivorans]QQD73724.1 FAD-binding oxidoreductase [Acidithiobacillus ferrivorans]
MAAHGEVVVLGAGIVGVSIALQLQLRGRPTMLLDQQGPGEGTSFGNAGLIQREAVMPHPFPRALATLLSYARNQSTEAYYRGTMLPRLAIPFMQYWYNSQEDRHRMIARHYAALITHCLDDHLALAGAAGAIDLLRPGGWLQVHEKSESLDHALKEAAFKAGNFAVAYDALDSAGVAAMECSLRPGLAGGIHWTQPLAVVDPHALTRAYLNYFTRMGGEFRTSTVQGVERRSTGWRIATVHGPVDAAEVVVALGAWSPDVTGPLGYHPPLFVKRGYHMHYAQAEATALCHPVLDADQGYMLVPMQRGIRLTTGAEFAHRDAPPSAIPLTRAEAQARRLLPALGRRLDADPWMGVRPCTPDMLPIIGRAPGHPGVWYAFGHCHQGLTLGPTTGRLLTEMMVGETPFTDPAPYRPERF